MPEPAFTDVFGAGATQDSSSFTISKANLPGLTAAAENTAESLIAGLILLWADTLSQANQDSNPDQQITVIDSDFPGYVTRNNQGYIQLTHNINFQKPDTSGGLDPNDY